MAEAPSSAGLSVELDDVHMSFAGVGARSNGSRLKVLDGITAKIPPAQFSCIVGPSGCGKSTLLRIIQALLKPDSGRVLLGGRPVEEPSLDVGFVFQQFNLLPWRTVLGNVEFGLENRGVGRRERRKGAREWIARVKLSDFESHFPSQLSGGMQQRVGLARALAVEPRLLLMDEPFGALDSQTKMLLQAELLRLWEQEEKTVIFITHDIEEALFLGDVVFVMGSAPSNFDQIIEVPFGRPRDDALRANPEFTQLRERIWESLKSSIVHDETP
jgi:NitT/TauT family transport system ATP-binding protein